ncbi:MAG: hypothetical protein QOE47_2179 [Pyrinomonadaceae bacterium]|jgi:hypothetical protein|nr:hypothetical protein [Pyrinomonadaceae bacterium]MDX6270272.1 hypothetical protein [Acidobacteriota bacterium]
MSSNEELPQEQEPEEESSSAGSNAGLADPSDLETSEGDRPIIIQGGGTANPS